MDTVLNEPLCNFIPLYSRQSFSIYDVFNGQKKHEKKKVTEKDGESGPENIWMHTDVRYRSWTVASQVFRQLFTSAANKGVKKWMSTLKCI